MIRLQKKIFNDSKIYIFSKYLREDALNEQKYGCLNKPNYGRCSFL